MAAYEVLHLGITTRLLIAKMKDDHLDDPLSIEGGRSGSADANGALMDFGGPPPVAQTLYVATPSRGSLSYPSGYSSNDSHGNSRPWWGNTEPLNINKRNRSQNPPAIRMSQHLEDEALVC